MGRPETCISVLALLSVAFLVTVAPSAEAASLFEPHTGAKYFDVSLVPSTETAKGSIGAHFAEETKDVQVVLVPFRFIIVDGHRHVLTDVKVDKHKKSVTVHDKSGKTLQFKARVSHEHVFTQFVAALAKYDQHLHFLTLISGVKKFFKPLLSLFSFSFGITPESVNRASTVTQGELKEESMDWGSLFDFSLDLDISVGQFKTIDQAFRLTKVLQTYATKHFPKLKLNTHISSDLSLMDTTAEREMIRSMVSTGAQEVSFTKESGFASTGIEGKEGYGTMGGLLARRNAAGTGYDSTFIGISNEHVWQKTNVGKDICAPAFHFQKAERRCRFNDCCRNAGKLLVTSEARSSREKKVSETFPDWGATLIPNGDMKGRSCTVPHIGEIKGMIGEEVAGFGMAVHKFGAKTHYTTGKILGFGTEPTTDTETFTVYAGEYRVCHVCRVCRVFSFLSYASSFV